jgi:hypothetical protein
MKPYSKKWMTLSIKIVMLIVSLAFLVSCQDQLLSEERSQSEPGISNQSPIADFNAAAMSCPDDLVNDGCNFTSGTGRDHPNQFLMVSMMNNCRTESLPANCAWDGNITQTQTMQVNLNNCCYPFNTFNAVLNGWKTTAQNNRPSGGYLITNYQRVTGYMATPYGPYVMVISVTYRKKGTCLIVGEATPKAIDFPQ